MKPWPQLELALVERLALRHDAFVDLSRSFLRKAELPEYSEAVFERAVTYPWSRPEGSFVLDGEVVSPLTPATVDGCCSGGTPRPATGGPSERHERYPLLAIGSNASPARLIAKLAHLPADQRRVIAIAGYLHGFDIGPLPRIAPYGAMPSTAFPSPGTAVRATVLWVTATQLAALTWTELGYHLGRLHPMEFEPDDELDTELTVPIDYAFLYVSRWGVLTEEGEPVALAALSARGRTAPEYTQEQLITRLATELLGPSATARDFLRHMTDDFLASLDAVGELLEGSSADLFAPTWQAMPGTGPRITSRR